MDSKIELLERLAALHRQGLLSDEEFNEQKAALLAGGIANPTDFGAPSLVPDSSGPAKPWQDAPRFDGDTEPDAASRAGKSSLGAIALAACGVAGIVAFCTVPGSPGRRFFYELHWRNMSTQALEQEYMRAYVAGASSFLECANGDDLESQAQCLRLRAIIDDAVAMSEILCTRDAANEGCKSGQDLKEMVATFDGLDQMGREIQDRTEYNPS